MEPGRSSALHRHEDGNRYRGRPVGSSARISVAVQGRRRVAPTAQPRPARSRGATYHVRVLILLPPSEGKTAPASGPSLDLDSLLDAERLTAARREVMSALAGVSRSAEAASVLGLGPRNAEQVGINLSLETSPCVSAHRLFTGVLYEAAGLDSIAEDPTGRAALERHCVVFSGLWGILSPTDLVPDHRLSMGTSLPGPGRLPAFWKPYLGPSLTGMAAQGLMVDCRSADYAAAWKPAAHDGIEVATVRVVRTADDGSRKVVSHMAKHACGLLAGELIRAVAGGPLPASARVDDIARVAGRLDGIDDVEVSEPDRQGRRALTLVTR